MESFNICLQPKIQPWQNKSTTWTLDCHTRIRRECRKITAEEPSSPCVHFTWWEFEGKIASLLGSGTYLECSGCSIANHQSPSQSNMVLYWRKKYCQSIHPLRHYAQGGCRRGRLCLTWCLIPWNDLRWQEPRIHSCCPQPPTMFLSACCRSSMYNSVVLAPLISSPQWLDEFQSP